MNVDEGLTLVVGFFMVIVVVKILKKIIQQPRPVGKALGGTYGMPSSRAATIFFLITCILLFLKYPTPSTIIIMVIVAVSLCIAKYLSRDHTIKQLVVGAGIGVAMGYLANEVHIKWLKR
jgi:membrane-associated phospholipid phosphatase